MLRIPILVNEHKIAQIAALHMINEPKTNQ